jgi:hypothetical protein
MKASVQQLMGSTNGMLRASTGVRARLPEGTHQSIVPYVCIHKCMYINTCEVLYDRVYICEKSFICYTRMDEGLKLRMLTIDCSVRQDEGRHLPLASKEETALHLVQQDGQNETTEKAKRQSRSSSIRC